jgi:hypothetical protein
VEVAAVPGVVAGGDLALSGSFTAGRRRTRAEWLTSHPAAT